MFEYVQGQEGDLIFYEGDRIFITKKEGEWWEGECKGKKGLFPANYVKIVESSPQPKTEVLILYWFRFFWVLGILGEMTGCHKSGVCCHLPFFGTLKKHDILLLAFAFYFLFIYFFIYFYIYLFLLFFQEFHFKVITTNITCFI